MIFAARIGVLDFSIIEKCVLAEAIRVYVSDGLSQSSDIDAVLNILEVLKWKA